MKKIVFGIIILFIFLLKTPALAADYTDLGNPGTGPYLGLEYGAATGLGSQDIRLTTARIITVALGLLGTICVALIVYAGFKWMTAGGNEDQAGEAKKIIYAAVIGMVIILSAYSIVRFVVPALFKATTGDNYQTTGDIY